MKDLSPEAQALVNAGRGEALPPERRARVKSALDGRLAAAPVPLARWLAVGGAALAVAMAVYGVDRAFAPPLPAPPPLEQPGPASGAVAQSDALAEEMALIGEAQAALAAHRPDRALTALARHEARFPQGLLQEERASARIVALCALGRTDETCRLARAFLTRSPQSPQAPRVRASCASSCPKEFPTETDPAPH